MAEQVQSILERMVLPLKDLRSREIFSSPEIQRIVERRRRAEYTLQRRGGAALLSDYLSYIEAEVRLERLRKLRKEKVLLEWQTQNESRPLDDDAGRHRPPTPHAYKTSGPGDGHIVSHIHFLYQRTLRKFHYPLEVLLCYANFAKETKSFKVLSRIYAEGLQHHPRECGLWIEAASFEYFGYVAQDYESTTSSTTTTTTTIHSKIAGSSIHNARVLLQRGLRINKSSAELWVQYFALELHYVQKLWGRKEVLAGSNDNNHHDREGDDEGRDEAMSSSLLPSKVIYENAIQAIPSDIQFRLRFIETCGMFPRTQTLVDNIMEGVSRDFGSSVEGWVARISYADDFGRREEGRSGGKKVASGNESGGDVGFLGMVDQDGTIPWEQSNVSGEEDYPIKKTKKARLEKSPVSGDDPALALLQEALDAVPTPSMYLEGARFLRMRIRRLTSDNCGENIIVETTNEDGVSYLRNMDEDVKGMLHRHATLLEELYNSATSKGISCSSTALILDQVDYLLNVAKDPHKAETVLRNAVYASTPKDGNDDARLWIQWAELSEQRMMESGSGDVEKVQPLPLTMLSPIFILRRALQRTPLYHRRAHTLLATSLMRRLMSQPTSSPEIDGELNELFQKLMLLSQGSDYSLSYVKKMMREDTTTVDDMDHEEGTEVNLASTALFYLKYTMRNNNSKNNNVSEMINAVRSIYTCVLYRSNYGQYCSDKTNEEKVDMKAFFDVCLQYEINNCHHCRRSCSTNEEGRRGGKIETKKTWTIRVMKLYDTAIRFFASGGSNWKSVVDGYQRDLDNFKYSN